MFPNKKPKNPSRSTYKKKVQAEEEELLKAKI
jgi:hypothetical protein